MASLKCLPCKRNTLDPSVHDSSEKSEKNKKFRVQWLIYSSSNVFYKTSDLIQYQTKRSKRFFFYLFIEIINTVHIEHRPQCLKGIIEAAFCMHSLSRYLPRRIRASTVRLCRTLYGTLQPPVRTT